MPRNSPSATSNETFLSARSCWLERLRSGCRARSFSVSIWWAGIWKDFCSSRTSIATGAGAAFSGVGGAVSSATGSSTAGGAGGSAGAAASGVAAPLASSSSMRCL